MLNTDWLELPASPESLGNLKLVALWPGSGVRRNYTILYDPARFASLWTAYAYTPSDSGSGQGSGWTQNPKIDDAYESSVTSSYESGAVYDRGHQIPNAVRNGNSARQAQTYYFTNSMPQISSFNQNIWNNLETAERNCVSGTDTVYVVTGPVFQTVGGNETVMTYKNVSNDNKILSVANYYYRVLLKVKRSSDGTITNALAIGFWMPHTADIAEKSYTSYVKSVSEIESYTGFDFFANLPDDLEATAESNTNWNTFNSF